LFNRPKKLKYQLIFSLIYSAGLRVSELCNFTLSDIDPFRMKIKIRRSKNRKDRYVPLSPLIFRGIQKYLEEYEPINYLFNGKKKGDKLSIGSVQAMFRIIVGKSIITKEVTLHTLRHSYATHLLEDGLDIVSIQKLLGHSNIQTTMVYLHVADTREIKAHSPFDTLWKLLIHFGKKPTSS